MSHYKASTTGGVRIGEGKRVYRRKEWTYQDTTNRVNRDQYIEAHLGSMQKEAETRLHDDRPMRLTAFAGTSGRGPRSERAEHWRSWDISSNSELAKATLEASGGTRTGSDVGSSSHHRGASRPRGDMSGSLPPHLHRNTLKMQLPLQHRLVNEFHDLVRDGSWKGMVGDGRKLTMRLINVFVRPLTASIEQQSRALSYYLYDLRQVLTVGQRLVMYQHLAEGFEGTSPDHLAVLLAGVKQLRGDEKTLVLGAIRDEIKFAGSLPPSLATAFALSAPLKPETYTAAITVFKKVTNPSFIPDGAWAALARGVAAGASTLEAVQAVVDAAVDADDRHYRNIELWNAYLEAAPLPHAVEMVNVNMPKYRAAPNMGTLAIISRKCVADKQWEVALDMLQRSQRLKPVDGDSERAHAAYRSGLDAQLATFRAAKRTGEIETMKRLVPNLMQLLSRR